MTATRINRKRSHDDIDDGDECLPISKRINSLHIEGQAQAVGHQQVLLPNQLNPFNGFCEEVASTNSHLIMNGNNVMYGQQYNTARCLDLAGQSPSSSLIPVIGGHVPVSNSASDNQIIPGHMMYSLQEGSSSLHSQCELYHQPNMQKHIPPQHLPLGTFSNHADSSSLSQGVLGIAGQNIMYSATNPMGAIANSVECNKCDEQQIPQGPYEPELGVSENPHYFDVNRLLYEAHLNRTQRTST